MAEPHKPFACRFCHLSKEKIESQDREGMKTVTDCGKLHIHCSPGGTPYVAHKKCMQYSAGLEQLKHEYGFGGFKIEEVQEEITRGKKLRCFVCKQYKKKKRPVGGATAGCAYGPCQRTFHYPCAVSHALTERIRHIDDENRQTVLYRVYCSEEHKKLCEESIKHEKFRDGSESDTGEEFMDSDHDDEYTRVIRFTPRITGGAGGEQKKHKPRKNSEQPNGNNSASKKSSGKRSDGVKVEKEKHYVTPSSTFSNERPGTSQAENSMVFTENDSAEEFEESSRKLPTPKHSSTPVTKKKDGKSPSTSTQKQSKLSNILPKFTQRTPTKKKSSENGQDCTNGVGKQEVTRSSVSPSGNFIKEYNKYKQVAENAQKHSSNNVKQEATPVSSGTKRPRKKRVMRISSSEDERETENGILSKSNKRRNPDKIKEDIFRALDLSPELSAEIPAEPKYVLAEPTPIGKLGFKTSSSAQDLTPSSSAASSSDEETKVTPTRRSPRISSLERDKKNSSKRNSSPRGDASTARKLKYTDECTAVSKIERHGSSENEKKDDKEGDKKDRKRSASKSELVKSGTISDRESKGTITIKVIKNLKGPSPGISSASKDDVSGSSSHKRSREDTPGPISDRESKGTNIKVTETLKGQSQGISSAGKGDVSGSSSHKRSREDTPGISSAKKSKLNLETPKRDKASVEDSPVQKKLKLPRRQLSTESTPDKVTVTEVEIQMEESSGDDNSKRVLCIVEKTDLDECSTERLRNKIGEVNDSYEDVAVWTPPSKLKEEITSDIMLMIMRKISMAIRSKSQGTFCHILKNYNEQDLKKDQEYVNFFLSSEDLKTQLLKQIKGEISTLDEVPKPINLLSSKKLGHVLVLLLDQTRDPKEEIWKKFCPPVCVRPSYLSPDFKCSRRRSEIKADEKEIEYTVLKNYLEDHVGFDFYKMVLPEDEILHVSHDDSVTRKLSKAFNNGTNSDTACYLIFVGPVIEEIVNYQKYCKALIGNVIEQKVTAKKDGYLLIHLPEELDLGMLLPPKPEHIEWFPKKGTASRNQPVTCAMLHITYK